MATALAYTKTGTKKDAAAKLNVSVFGVEANHELLGQAYRTYLANGRTSNAKVLTRGEVRGGGKKPWKQKGTGRARAGSSRIPHWRGGGVVFGPTGNENYTLNMPIKMKRQAIRQALSLQAHDKKVIIIDAFESAEGRVKDTIVLLDKLKLEGKITMVVDQKTDLLRRATNNVAGLDLVSANYLNVFTILNADWIVMTDAAHTAVGTWLEDKKAATKKADKTEVTA